jgi:carbamoyltransferase
MVRNVYVLGINDGHDSSVSIVRNGEVIAAITEERLRKIKHFSGTPEKSLKEIFKVSKVHPQDVDLIAISGYNIILLTKEASRIHRTFSPLVPISPIIESSRKVRNFAVNVLHCFRPRKRLFETLERLGLDGKEIMFVEHHLAHAASAYRSCPWEDDTLVFTSDFVGDYLSSTVSIGRKDKMMRIKDSESTFSHSLGVFYTVITKYLGLKPFNDEYKMMGLAPYGNPSYASAVMRRFIKISDKNPLRFQNLLGWHFGWRFNLIHSLLEFHRFDNIAAAAQQLLENLLCKWIKNAIRKTGIHKVALAGGVFLNVKANMKIREMPEVDEIYIFPAATDDGTSFGAALEGYVHYCRREGLKVERHALKNLYLGSKFSSEEIQRSIKKEKLWKTTEYYGDIGGVVGELISKGKIIAWFQNGMEFGPRALGNRSILCDASDWHMVKRLNQTIKHRTWWMPFAPAVLQNRIGYYLINGKDSPYMTMAFHTSERRDEIIAAVHPQDFTARPQTLKKATNPPYYHALKTFEGITGFGGFLNTSFNLHGYPIVCTPDQAIWTYKNSALDGLAMGNFLILRHK